jgi:hypothetical protein
MRSAADIVEPAFAFFAGAHLATGAAPAAVVGGRFM